MELSQGMILQNYKIIRLLGEGGMGEVYLAEETLLGRKVAIKRLNPLLTKDPKLIERFKNEAKAQARLNHPQIVVLHNFFFSEGAYYIVMEYASGLTLDRLMQQTGLLPEERAMPIFKQICEALSYAHKRAIVHRDIKPSNIMVNVEAGYAVKIMDFGIALIMDSAHLTQTGTQMGTIHYMSPEQVYALKDIDHRSDIYSAGVLLYRMLTGRLPFDADTDSTFQIQKQIVDAPMPDPREIYAFISEETVQLLYKLTQKDRDKRPAEILQALQQRDEKIKEPIIAVPTQKQAEYPIKEQMGELIFVEGGSFMMGSKDFKNERPIHEVSISSFYISKYQVTQEEWEELMGSNPSCFKGDELPVERVSWYDAIEYCNKRSIKEGLKPCYRGNGGKITCRWNANGYRLPTEAEWEYAARGGKKSKDYKYSGSDDIDDVSWYYNNSGDKTHRVGENQANELGIYDMSGNVWEWCWDWYSSDYYEKSPSSKPRGPRTGEYRVLRGGSWSNFDDYCRVADRNADNPSVRFNSHGLRILRAIQ